VRIKLQLAVAVAAAVAVTALTMSALAVGQDQPKGEAGTKAAGTAGVGETPPPFVTDCLTKAGVAVPDGLDARALKEWVFEHTDAREALEKCAPPDGEGVGGTTAVCKAVPGKPGVLSKDGEALRAKKRAQSGSSSSAR
jgi:hypothetical protein